MHDIPQKFTFAPTGQATPFAAEGDQSSSSNGCKMVHCRFQRRGVEQHLQPSAQCLKQPRLALSNLEDTTCSHACQQLQCGLAASAPLYRVSR